MHAHNVHGGIFESLKPSEKVALGLVLETMERPRAQARMAATQAGNAPRDNRGRIAAGGGVFNISGVVRRPIKIMRGASILDKRVESTASF